MMRQKAIKRYFEKHPEIRDALNKDLHQYARHKIKDKDIPDFDVFVSRNSIIKTIFEEHENPVSPRHAPWYSRKSFVIAVISVVVVFVFFAFTPVGRAWVGSLFKTVVQWFDSGVSIEHASDTDEEFPVSAVSVGDNANSYIKYFNTPEDVRSNLDIQIAYLDERSDEIVDIEVICEDRYKRIQSVYMVDSSEVTVTQIVSPDKAASATQMKFEDTRSVDYAHPDDLRFIGYINNEYGYSIAYFDSMSVSVHAKNMDYDRYMALLAQIKVD